MPEIHLTQPAPAAGDGPERRSGNWVFGEPGRADCSSGASWIDDGQRAFHRRAAAHRHRDRRAASDACAIRIRRRAPIAVDGGGRWQGSAFTHARHRRNRRSRCATRDAPYRIDVRASAGATHAHARGTLLDPLRLRDFDLQHGAVGPRPGRPVSADSASPSRLRRPTRSTAASAATASIWHYDDFTGRVGDSDMAGDASVDTGRARPYLRADLRSKRLDFDDLAGFVGGTPQAGRRRDQQRRTAQARPRARRPSARVLPDTPYELDKLRAMDADVRLRAQRINAPQPAARRHGRTPVPRRRPAATGSAQLRRRRRRHPLDHPHGCARRRRSRTRADIDARAASTCPSCCRR